MPLCSFCVLTKVTAAAPLCSDQDKTAKQIMGFVVPFFLLLRHTLSYCSFSIVLCKSIVSTITFTVIEQAAQKI